MKTEKKYQIAWAPKNGIGRSGCGTQRFNLEDAKQLCEELNRDHPNFNHEPKEVCET